MNAPLAGVRVVEFGQLIAAPAAGQSLADLGADVIKVESMIGEASRKMGTYGESILDMYNRGKRGIALDMSTSDGLEVARRLVADADIVLQNMRPGVMDRFGLGARELRTQRPELVYGTVSGFGLHGPSRNRSGLDIAAQAESGIMSITGEAGREPQRVGFTVVDAAAAHVLAQGVLGAYVGRLRTGVGATVETSLLQVAVHLQAAVWGEYFITGLEPTRKGNGQPYVAPAADVMPTRDGAVVVSAYADEQFVRLCTVLGIPDVGTDARFATNERRVANRPEMLAALREAFLRLTSDQAVDLLATNALIVGRINTYGDTLKSADVEALGVFVTVEDPDGVELPAVGAPWSIHGVQPARSRAPRHGEHTAQVLQSLGYGDAAIADLVRAGAVHAAL